MATARTIIEDMLRKIHVLGVGAPLSSDEAEQARRLINQMLATWSAQGDLIFTETIETFPLTGAASYTIGSGADFNTTRPLYISAAYTSDGGTDYPLKEIDNKQYSEITQKSIGNIPRYYYYNADFPTATIRFDTVPSSVTTITLTSFKQLTEFSSLDTTFNMPPEYEAAIIYNGAVWISPEYERVPSKQVLDIAKETKDAVESQNKRNEQFLSQIDVPADRRGNGGNIYGGWLV